MRSLNQVALRWLVMFAVAGSLLLALGAKTAIAAPALEVSLQRDEPVVSRSDERIDYAMVVKNTAIDPTVGTVTAVVELPGGSQTYVAKTFGTGWSCSSQPPVGAEHAKATCSRAGINGGETAPTLTVGIGLGIDAPSHVVTTATVSSSEATTVSAADEFEFAPPRAFEVTSFDAAIRDASGNNYTQAGGHPFTALAAFAVTKHRTRIDPGANDAGYEPMEQVKTVVVETPRGFVGNALAAPELCDSIEKAILTTCPSNSIVGGISLRWSGLNLERPIYSMVPEFGVPAQFAFASGPEAFSVPVTFAPHLRAEDGYAISFVSAPVPQIPALLKATPILCGFGGKVTGLLFSGCRKDEPSDSPYPHPLFANPTRCSGPPPTTRLRVASWQDPTDFKTPEFTFPAITGCDAVRFEPAVQFTPTSREADSPTGLDVTVKMPVDGLLERSGVSQANLDNVNVTLPKGMSVNPAVANGLGACSLAQVKLKSNDPDECPQSSRIGTVKIETPVIRKPLLGSVYVAKQRDNPFNSTLGLYMVFSSARDGIIIKVAGKVTPDPVTGQLTSSFVENPEAPFSQLSLHLNEGPRAPLINPPKCGTYAIHSELSPWSAVNPANPTPQEIVAADSTYEVSSGPNGGPCPDGGLAPRLRAGLKDAQAGSKSPFLLSVSRDDGTQRFVGLDVANPVGLTAYLKGISYCPDAVLASISEAEETGRSEIDRPACPASSLVGTVSAGTGSGPFPFYIDTGRAYLAGPYKGAPISLGIVTPAVAGPFDLGSVVVRTPLYIDPVTSRVTAKSDPIPTILHGILLDVRDIRIALDRPGFTAAPTNCEPHPVEATVKGEQGSTADVSSYFQAAGCRALKFRPKLNLRLFGGTRRGSHPRLVAKLRMPAGSANIGSASVALPHSEFLEQAHIRTICTRVQFAANQCPKGAVYGRAEATTPVLDYKLRGPVYLRSSSNPLPDLVAVLRGPETQPIEVDLAGRIDSVNGGIRTSFDVVPDQPVSSFTLRMQGGRKGLLVNSRNICKTVNRATARFTGQNGKRVRLRPALKASCRKARRQKKSRHHRRSQKQKQHGHHRPQYGR